MDSYSEVRLEVNVTPFWGRDALLDAVPFRHRVGLGRLRERAALPLRPLLLRFFGRSENDAVRDVVLSGAKDRGRDVL